MAAASSSSMSSYQTFEGYVMQTDLVTQWYWKDDQGRWCPYICLSDSIERQYQEWRAAMSMQVKTTLSEYKVTMSTNPERTYVIHFDDMKQRRLAASEHGNAGNSVPTTYRIREVRRKSKTVQVRSLLWPSHWLWSPHSLPVQMDLKSDSHPVGATFPTASATLPTASATLPTASATLPTVEPPAKRARLHQSPLTIATATPPPLTVPRRFMEAGAVLVDLPPTSEQYRLFYREFMYSINTPIHKAFQVGVPGSPSYKPAEYLTTGFTVDITQISQVQHARLWRVYEERRLQVQDEVDPLSQFEVQHLNLFHGTSSDSVDSIVQNGLNISMSQSAVVGRLWGNGVYVTPLASFATHYARLRGANQSNEFVVLICRAVIGMSEIGSRGKQGPSQIPDGRGKRYHSTYDHPVAPFQYCLWEPNQVYVDAIVRFRCDELPLPPPVTNPSLPQQTPQ